MGQERSYGIFHTDTQRTAGADPAGQGLLAVADKQFVQVGLSSQKAEMRCPTREGNLILISREGYLAAEEGVELLRGIAAGMKEADTDRPEGGTRQLLRETTEQSRPELHLVPVQMAWHTDVAVVDTKVRPKATADPDAVIRKVLSQTRFLLAYTGELALAGGWRINDLAQSW
jgi:hypothetical protein